MEDVLEEYAAEDTPEHPLVCFDEKPVVLHAETRPGLPVAPGRSERNDYEYKRQGTGNLFVMVEPLVGWRPIAVTERHTKQDYARCLQWLVDMAFPQAKSIRLVQDNLNTHQPSALYETFPPEEALRILRKLEFHYTPKHGSWLNMAEIEISVFKRRCLSRPVGAPLDVGAPRPGLGDRAHCRALHYPLAVHLPGRSYQARGSLSRHPDQSGLSPRRLCGSCTQPPLTNRPGYVISIIRLHI
jgi:hypothetical protein